MTGSQVRALMSSLAELYRPGAGDFPTRVLSVMRTIAGADSYSYNHFGPAGPLGVQVAPADGPTLPDAYTVFKQHVHQHPALAHYRATNDGAACRISDFLSDRQFRALALYREFYRHTGTDYQLVAGVPLPGGTLIAVALNRQGTDFSDEETALAGLLRAHIAQATAITGLPSPDALRAPDGTPLLTARQASIMRLVAAGQPDQQIARSLGISVRTVHAHLQNIYRTLGVSSRTEALARLRPPSPQPG